MMKLLFIVGLQKSGTSLLNRLLMLQPNVSNPFLPEGKFFWGDDPPFKPTAKPCGELYQKYSGTQGHVLNQNDFRTKDLTLLQNRIIAANVKTPVLMNKNPYNTVRLDWLKTIFPECKIVAIYRQPLANVFSLYKKYLIMKGNDDADEGWWGLKPANWNLLLSQDKVEQASQQWSACNQHIIRHRNCIDHLLSYTDLCKNPKLQLNIIMNLLEEQASEFPKEPLVCMDTEYQSGGLLESRNKILRKTGKFGLTLDGSIEIKRFSKQQVNTIENITAQTFQALLQN